VQKAAKRLEREQKALAKDAEKSGTLLPMTETIGEDAKPADTTPNYAPIVEAPTTSPEPELVDILNTPSAPAEKEEEYDADSVFAKLKNVKINDDDKKSG